MARHSPHSRTHMLSCCAGRTVRTSHRSVESSRQEIHSLPRRISCVGINASASLDQPRVDLGLYPLHLCHIRFNCAKSGHSSYRKRGSHLCKTTRPGLNTSCTTQLQGLFLTQLGIRFTQVVCPLAYRRACKGESVEHHCISSNVSHRMIDHLEELRFTHYRKRQAILCSLNLDIAQRMICRHRVGRGKEPMWGWIDQVSSPHLRGPNVSQL